MTQIDRKALIEIATGVRRSDDPGFRALSGELRREMHLGAQRAAVVELRARSTPPAACSPEIIAAPGRGPCRIDPQWETVMTPSGPRPRRSTMEGFHPVRGVTGLERMQDQSARRDKEAPPLFTASQVNAAEDFANLVHHCLGVGVKCSSLEALGGGSYGGSWIDAVIDDIRRLRRMLQAVGNDLVLSPVRSGHADRPRRAIRTLELVQSVCCGGLTITEVLRSGGWSADHKYRLAAREALCAALDRLWGL